MSNESNAADYAAEYQAFLDNWTNFITRHTAVLKIVKAKLEEENFTQEEILGILSSFSAGVVTAQMLLSSQRRGKEEAKDATVLRP